MIFEQRYLPSSISIDVCETALPPLPTVISPSSIYASFDEPDMPRKNPTLNIERRSSGSNFAFCLPSTCEGDKEEAYGLTDDHKGDFLSVNDRLVCCYEIIELVKP